MDSFSLEEDNIPSSSGTAGGMSFPVLGARDLNQVAETIQRLFDPSTSGSPGLAKQLQHELQRVQGTGDAWGLIAGLAGHEDPNVRFFGAHTAQVKISRDWTSLPPEMHAALLRLLLDNLGHAVSPTNPHSYQAANAPVVRKLFGSLASLLLRLPFHLFPSPLLQPLHVLAQAAQAASLPPSLPPSLPASGYNTPNTSTSTLPSSDSARSGWKMRLWALEWLTIVVEELGRAGISEQKRNALRRHLEVDLPRVMETIKGSMSGARGMNDVGTMGGRDEVLKEMEGACRCAEAWIGYGLGADELTALLPSLYDLLPLPAACSAISEALSESIFKFGKGTKVLTEPLIAWAISPTAQALIGGAEGEPSDEVVAFVKMLCALVEHSSEWIVARIQQADVQAFLGLILRVTGWDGTGGVDENVSELTLSIYPLLQEAVMDSSIYSSEVTNSPEWIVVEGFFAELVNVTRRKSRWPGEGSGAGDLGGLDKDDRENFDKWRRDAGEVVVCAYYILRDDMLRGLVETLVGLLPSAQWHDIEAVLHCIRYASEGVPLGEEHILPTLFSQDVLSALAQRPQQGKGEERLRLTVVCVIQAYEEWFKFHPDHLPYVLEYLVPSLTASAMISRSAADALKALCDICRTKLVRHIGAFAQLHDKIGDLGAEEQTKVVQAITSVIQALPPAEAIGPVEGIVNPIVDRLSQAVLAVQTDPSAQPLLVQTISALTASFKGLSPSDDDIFDLSDEGPSSEENEAAVRVAREDERLQRLRSRIEEAIQGVVGVWSGDGELADAISSLVKHSTLASETLISLSAMPLLSLVTTAAERSSSALWMSLASTLVLRINAPPSTFPGRKAEVQISAQDTTPEEVERWNIVGDSAARLVQVAGGLLGAEGGKGMADHPDVVEGWFKFCSSLASRFPGVLLRLPTQLVEGYMTLGLLGLATHERFSLKSTCEFFVALLVATRFPAPTEPLADPLFKHYGPQLLRGIILSAGSEGPRSVIPNLAELLASFVQRIPGEEMMRWMDGILAEEGFPDARATGAAKSRLKEVVLKSRTTKKMREALHEFALVSRGLDNTTYGNATALALDR